MSFPPARRASRFLPLVLLPAAGLLVAACASKTAPPPASAPEAAPPESALSAEVRSTMDPSLDPCDDFYAYACGGWLATTELPGDETRWGRSFSVIRQQNTELLRTILNEAAATAAAQDAPTEAAPTNPALLGAYYGSCVDLAAAEAAGLTPVEADLAAAGAVTDIDSALALSARLHARGVVTFFDWGVMPDYEDPSLQILHMAQGGLGLPDRDFYFPETDDRVALLADYEAFVAQLLTMSGTDAKSATAQAEGVVAFETALATVSKRRQELRDPSKTYNRIERVGLQKLTPNLDWTAFLADVGAPDITAINVRTPSYYEGLDALLKGAAPESLQAYMRWHIVLDAAPHLTEQWRQAHFDFAKARIAGQKERRPLWKDCVDNTNRALGDALSSEYVARRFAGDSKPVATAMIEGIEEAFEASLPELAWMDDTTRERAVEKARAVTNKIGYPDTWRDYSAMDLGDHWFGNRAEGVRFEIARQLAQVGQPVDRSEWYMPASMVNAYYNPMNNEIVFPAGILQPPFFSADYPTAMNYGAIGMVMGHELTHGFDDSGRKFDKDGALAEWWEPEVAERYEAAASCVDDLYSGYTVGDGLKVNGKLTLGENIADLGGIQQAHAAWRMSAAGQAAQAAQAGAAGDVAGLTGDQLLFTAYAQSWCSLATPEMEQLLLTVDSHSPGRFRVNGPLSQYPAFAEAFSCAPGSAMAPEERCSVW